MKKGKENASFRRSSTMISESDVQLSDISLRTTSNYSRAWLAILGISACADFAASVLADFFPQEYEIVNANSGCFLFCRKEKVLVEANHTIVHDMFQFLDMWHIEICIFFSLLCFIHAFVRARWSREKKLLELDRKRLLQESYLPIMEWSGAWGAYYFSVVLALLCLPVGFYLSILSLAQHGFRLSSTMSHEVEFDIVYIDERGITQIGQHFTTHSTHSLLFALCSYSSAAITHLGGVTMKEKIRSITIMSIRHLISFAVFNPRKFMQRLRKVRTGVRWTKHLAPLFGPCNKLLGNVKDLMTKFRQCRAAKRARLIRDKLWRQMDENERREAALIRAQNIVRAMHARKTLRALVLTQDQKECIASVKLQTAMRASLSHTRVNVTRTKRELKGLLEQSMNNASHMSINDRRRMYQLQNEFNLKAKLLMNEKLLLRPNTTFAVFWKVLFVVCTIFEISLLALNPRLKGYRNKETGKRMGIGEALDYHIVPAPMSEWEQCAPWLVNPAAATKKDPPLVSFGTMQKRFSWYNKSIILSRPWYCQEPFVMMQAIFIAVLRIALTQTLVIVGFVYFLDVFVTFFTGELDSDTGKLKPKPFFTRWIFPGLLLQLLINPEMETTSRYVSHLVKNTLQVGPLRAWRWTEAMFYPLFIILVDATQRFVWKPLVQQQNANLHMKESGKTEIQRRMSRRYTEKFMSYRTLQEGSKKHRKSVA